MGQTRPGDLGGAWRPQTFHALKNYGMEGVRFCDQTDRALRVRSGGKRGALAQDPRPDPPGSVRAWLRQDEKHFYAVLRVGWTGRQPVDDPDDRLSPA